MSVRSLTPVPDGGPADDRDSGERGGEGKGPRPRTRDVRKPRREHGRLALELPRHGGSDAARHRGLAAQRIADRVVARPRGHAGLALQVGADGIQLGRVDLAVDQTRNLLVHHHLRFSSVPSSGRNSAAIDSRARKMRDRTVPIGQFITLAISS